MDKKIFKCALAGGLIVFLWSMVSWMLLPWHSDSLHRFKNERKVYEVIKENALESGIYVLPNMYLHRDGMSPEEVRKDISHQHHMMAKGPVMFASVCREGISGMSVKPFVIAFLIQVIAAGIITWMLLEARVISFKRQVIFVTTIGLLVAILGFLPSWNWWGFSLSYTLCGMFDAVIGWFLAGVAISKLCHK